MNDTSKMKREEVIFELARYCHPSWYHWTLQFSTETLKALLTFYRSGGERHVRVASLSIFLNK